MYLLNIKKKSNNGGNEEQNRYDIKRTNNMAEVSSSLPLITLYINGLIAPIKIEVDRTN